MIRQRRMECEKEKRRVEIEERKDMNLNDNRAKQILEKLKTEYLIFDGGYGTRMVEAGLQPGERPEMWNFTHEKEILQFHRDYLNAGCHLIKTNTFGANRVHYKKEIEENPDFLEDLIQKAVSIAKRAVTEFEQQSGNKTDTFVADEYENCAKGHFCAVALDIGPIGKLLEPLGDLAFEQAIDIFAQTVRAGVKSGADCILIETMTDSYETKAAVLAAKENSDLPVFVTNVYQENGKLLTGTSAVGMIAMLEGLRVDAVGMNCGLGPAQMESLMETFEKYASVPVIVNPNAGLPEMKDGKTIYSSSKEEFLEKMKGIVKRGARIVGGCCGTTPEYICGLAKMLKNRRPPMLKQKTESWITSAAKVVEFGKKPVLIGERINPTGKKKLQQALRERNMDYILEQGLSQKNRFADVLDVNVGLPEIDETELLPGVVDKLQQTFDLPLQIDTADAKALRAAMRIYNGKPMVNSVNGKAECMHTVFPLVKKYGGLVVGLTLDEQGIPKSAEERLAIAKRIYETAAEYGIAPKDIIIDPLAMAVSADPGAAMETLSCIKMIKEQFGGLVSLGVSNVSFGLPGRENLNAVFFASALEKGLDAAIMNPNSDRMLQTYFGYCALHQMDEQFLDYIEMAKQWEIVSRREERPVIDKTVRKEEETSGKELFDAVKKGLVRQAEAIARRMLENCEPMRLIDEQMIPALDDAGRDFEKGRIFLPQLLMCSKAAQKAFEVLRKAAQAQQGDRESKASVVLATVKGDVHDIGKNIVKVLLENYGYDVVDMGIDVDPEKIVETVQKKHIQLVGLSALMTTTVPNMEETVRQLREAAPWCKTVVGGAVLNQKYADKMKADCYAPTAMDTVRFAEKLFVSQAV